MSFHKATIGPLNTTNNYLVSMLFWGGWIFCPGLALVEFLQIVWRLCSAFLFNAEKNFTR